MNSKSTVHSSNSKMAPPVTVVQVPTKTYDGGVTEHEAAARKGSMKSVNKKQEDPFLWYSNQERRMNAMLHKDSDVPATATNNNEKVVRKTRLSFEIHPSLLFDDMILDSDLEYQDDDGYFDLLEAYLTMMPRKLTILQNELYVKIEHFNLTMMPRKLKIYANRA